ncbi:MAG: hypothetical protein B7Y41_05330 [Hydrogenophilales bacterium 28-61-23]|nr:MAG: hypothetical protein B7Y41_05330 [Hydrogenophilales bacterium 28-61-23]
MKIRHPILSLPQAALPKAGLPDPALLALAVSFALGLTLSGCANVNPKSADGTTKPNAQADASKPVTPPYVGGGYYKNDGPGANPPDNLAQIPDAVPKKEARHPYANNAYKVLGNRYIPLAENAEYKARGLASWYGRKFHGNSTAIGEPYDMYAMSAAHPTLPLPSYARVTNMESGKSVIVRVNDRGPFHPGRIIDLSYTAAYKLDILKKVTPVEVELVEPGDAPTSFAARSEEDIIPAPISPAEIVAKPESPAMTPGKAIYLQLGAFTNPATAEAVLARVTAKLSQTLPGVMRFEINGLHKIHAGPFANAESADQSAKLLHQDMGIKAFKVIAEAPANTLATTAPAVTSAAAENAIAPGLYLQLAAVSSPSAAEALSNRVKTRFGNELPGLNQVNTGKLYKLQAGPFTTPAAAEVIAQAYQQDFGVKPYRVSY